MSIIFMKNSRPRMIKLFQISVKKSLWVMASPMIEDLKTKKVFAYIRKMPRSKSQKEQKGVDLNKRPAS
jgi:hypothetical protein